MRAGVYSRSSKRPVPLALVEGAGAAGEIGEPGFVGRSFGLRCAVDAEGDGLADAAAGVTADAEAAGAVVAGAEAEAGAGAAADTGAPTDADAAVGAGDRGTTSATTPPTIAAPTTIATRPARPVLVAGGAPVFSSDFA